MADIQVWARDAYDGTAAQARKTRPIAEKASQRWVKSFQRTAEVQVLCPQSRLVNLADPAGTYLLVRASRTTQRQDDADVATTTLEEALERLRWSIKVFHCTLKSGCRCSLSRPPLPVPGGVRGVVPRTFPHRPPAEDPGTRPRH